MTTEAIQLIFPNNMKNMRINEVINIMSQSRVNPSELVRINPATAADMPRIPAMFHMFEPITVPTPISTLPDNEAITADPNSGRDVPIAEAVTPKIISDIPKAPPISTKLSTKRSADFITIIREIANTPRSATSSINRSPEQCFRHLL